MSAVPKNSAAAYVALGIGVVCIACAAIFAKIAAVPGATSAFYRVLFAGVVAIPACLWNRPLLPSRNAVLLTLVGGSFLAIDLVLWQIALLTTSATNATLLANIAPLWVALGALILFRENLGSYFWLALVLALAGMTFVVGGGTHQFGKFNNGDLLAVGASLFYGLYFLVTQRVRAGMDTLTFLALSITSGVTLSFAVCVALRAPLAGFNARSWAALAALGLLSHFCGYLAINYALGHMPATPVSVILLANPVITAVLAIPLLGEPLSWQQIIGGTLVFAGIYLVNRRRLMNGNALKAHGARLSG